MLVTAVCNQLPHLAWLMSLMLGPWPLARSATGLNAPQPQGREFRGQVMRSRDLPCDQQ
jgi:hypothetical protein